jgi:Lar family restriction alleviation protein
MNEAEKLACPFCGNNNPQMASEMGHFSWYSFVKCPNCGAQSAPNRDEDDAIKSWNVRAGGRQPTMSKTAGTKHVGISDLLGAFDEWWNRVGQYYDPDTDDVPWFDKRRALAEHAFDAATAQSRNYVANDSTCATEVKFTNGRVVKIADGFLQVEAPNDGAMPRAVNNQKI